MWPLCCTANPPPSPSSSFGATAKYSRDPEHVFDNSPWHSALILCHLTSWHWLGIGRWSQAITLLTSHLAPCTQTSGWVEWWQRNRWGRVKGCQETKLGQNIQRVGKKGGDHEKEKKTPRSRNARCLREHKTDERDRRRWWLWSINLRVKSLLPFINPACLPSSPFHTHFYM